MTSEAKSPREYRTAFTDAVEVLNAVASVYWDRNHEPDDADFFERYFDPMFADPATSGDSMMKITPDTLTNEHPVFMVGLIACAYAIEATRAHKLGKESLAWSFVSDAKFQLGVFTLAVEVPPEEPAETPPEAPPPISVSARTLGQAGGRSRGKPEWREQVRAWCERHLPEYASKAKPSLNSLMRGVVAARLNDAAEGTVRNWIVEFAIEWRLQGRWPSR